MKPSQTQNAATPAINIALSFMLLLAVWSCGSDDKKSGSQRQPENPDQTPGDDSGDENPGSKIPVGSGEITPVLAFLGGYTSCPGGESGPAAMDLAEMFSDAKAALKENGFDAEPAYLLSCYGVDPEIVTYVMSSAPEKIKNRTVDAMHRDFAALLKTLTTPRVFMTGHSYGAYTALEMLKIQENPLDLRGLVTLDAISKVGCTPAGALPAILGTGPAPKGCLEAPSDITGGQLSEFSKRTGTWLNFYQTDSEILHSGEFPNAKNTRMTYTSGGVNPHNDLLFDQVVKDAVVSLVIKSISPVADEKLNSAELTAAK